MVKFQSILVFLLVSMVTLSAHSDMSEAASSACQSPTLFFDVNTADTTVVTGWKGYYRPRASTQEAVRCCHDPPMPVDVDIASLVNRIRRVSRPTSALYSLPVWLEHNSNRGSRNNTIQHKLLARATSVCIVAFHATSEDGPTNTVAPRASQFSFTYPGGATHFESGKWI